MDIFLNGINIFDILLNRVGIIETKITQSTITFGQTKIEADTLCMTNMQIAVRFRWKTGMNLFD